MRAILTRRAANRALGLVILGASFASAASGQAMTAAERQQLIEKLDASQKKLFAALQGVSEAEWHWKPAPDKWSIAEVADHIDLAEIKTPQLVHDMATNAPATPEKKAEVSGKDQRVASEIPDRTQHRMMRPDFLAPTDRWPSPAALEKDFLVNRAKTLAYVRTTQDDVRSHMAPHPEMGVMDGYQWLLLIAAHCERHTAQILEIKAMPGYPKS
jgi:hypothetical protein